MTEKELLQPISRLAQRLANDPASRAFVPLADEYLRQNLPEDAILVLTEGIKNHPTYVAARMMLGKTYQRVGRVAEARQEFEEVVRLHPDNVLAYKKLALLHKDAGQLGSAVETCNKILTIDPHDKRAKEILAYTQEEISAVEDRASQASSFPILPPQVSQDLYEAEDILQLPEVEEMAVVESLPDLPAREVEADVVALIPPAQTDPVSVSIIEQVIPLAFVPQTAYNPTSLYQIRLKEWLVSIEEKGVRK